MATSAFRYSALAVFAMMLVTEAVEAAQIEYRLLATNRTSTMESEMNSAGADGFRFRQVMGGETAFGGKETVVAMAREVSDSFDRAEYKLLATSRTSTMQNELDQAGRDGYRYVGQTVFQTAFGGEEVVVMLERDPDREPVTYQYLLLATLRTSTLEREMQEVGEDGFVLQGLTVGETRFGGREVLAILSRSPRED